MTCKHVYYARRATDPAPFRNMDRDERFAEFERSMNLAKEEFTKVLDSGKHTPEFLGIGVEINDAVLDDLDMYDQLCKLSLENYPYSTAVLTARCESLRPENGGAEGQTGKFLADSCRMLPKPYSEIVYANVAARLIVMAGLRDAEYSCRIDTQRVRSAVPLVIAYGIPDEVECEILMNAIISHGNTEELRSLANYHYHNFNTLRHYAYAEGAYRTIRDEAKKLITNAK